MSNYTMSGPGVAVAPITAAQISQIDLTSSYGLDNKKLPNKKISFDVHTANGGYVVRVAGGIGIGDQDNLYVIGDNQDLGQELGKIVTHHTLAKT